MKKKSLFILLPNLEPGGAEHVVMMLLNYFDRTVFKMTLIVIDSGDGNLRPKVPADIRLIALNKRRVRSALPALITLLRLNKPDIIFSNLSHLNLGLAMCKCWLPPNSNLVVRESNIISQNVRLYSFSFVFKLLYKIFYKNIDIIICQSDEMADDLRQYYNIPSRKIRTINNPLDILSLQKRAGEFVPKRTSEYVFVACGRLDYQKGFDLLLHSLSDLSNPNWVLWMIGEGKLARELRELSADLGISDKVTFLGFKENPYPYLKYADLFILSSRFEGIPNVVLESLALKTPVIATPAPGGVTALLSKSKACIVADDISVDGISSALEAYFKDTRFQKIEDELVAPFQVKFVTRQFEKTFLEIV